MTLRLRHLAVLAVTATLAVGGCGHPDRTAPAVTGPGSSGAPAAPASVGPAAPAPTADIPGDTGAPPPAPTRSAPTRLAAGPTIDSDPACRPQVLQEATAAAVRGQTVSGVEVFACRSGFARLVATGAGSAEITGGNQFFLRLDDNRRWRVVARTGADGDCGDTSATAEMKTVCAGLT